MLDLDPPAACVFGYVTPSDDAGSPPVHQRAHDLPLRRSSTPRDPFRAR